jgi:hypothetical protein
MTALDYSAAPLNGAMAFGRERGDHCLKLGRWLGGVVERLSAAIIARNSRRLYSLNRSSLPVTVLSQHKRSLTPEVGK